MKNRVQTTIRFDADFHQELKLEVIKRHTSIERATEDALKQWMAGGATAAPRPVAVPTAVAGVSKEEQALAATFIDFVRSGEPAAVELVKHALELHVQKQRKARKRGSAS